MRGMRRLIHFFFVALIFFTAQPCFPWSGKCVGVSEGDTIKVMYFGKAVRIRLYGIDCPERGQSFSTQSLKFTSKMVFGKRGELYPLERDRFGRTIAWVWVNGKSLNKELLRVGLAWWCRKSAPDRTDLAELEREAQAANVGLWSMPNPVPPWEFRRR